MLVHEHRKMIYFLKPDEREGIMAKQTATSKWYAAEIDYDTLSGTGLCDILRSCFTEAQKETLKFGQQKLGLWKDGDDVDMLVDGALRMAFQEVGCDIKNPTLKGCRDVVAVLAAGATAWGTPVEIVRHHMGEMNAIFVKLGLEPIPLD